MLIRDILNLKPGTIHGIDGSRRLTDAVDLMVEHDVAKAVIKETSMENRLLKRYIESSPVEPT